MLSLQTQPYDRQVRVSKTNVSNVQQSPKAFGFGSYATDTVSFSAKNSTTQNTLDGSKLREQLKETKEKQGFIGKAWDLIKNTTHIGAGSNKAEAAIKKFEKGEITEEAALKAVNGYKEGQKMCVDVGADIASGILAVGAFAFAVPTGGASLAIGLGVSTAFGAGVKIAIKAGDAAVGGREYSAKDLLYDTATGAINGLLAPVTNGIGASLSKTMGTKLGLTVVKDGAEVVVGQGFKSMIVNQSVDVVGGSIAKRALALGAGMAVDGALGGAADNATRAALKGENVLEAGIQGAIGGMIMAPLIGGGMRVAGKAGKKLATEMKHKNAVNNIVPEVEVTTGKKPALSQESIAKLDSEEFSVGKTKTPPTTNAVKHALAEPVAGDNIGIGLRTVKNGVVDNDLLNSTVYASYEKSVAQLEVLSRSLDADIKKLEAFQDIPSIKKALDKLKPMSDTEIALPQKIELLQTAANQRVPIDVDVDVDIVALKASALKARADFAQDLQARLHQLATQSLDKDLPDIGSLVSKLSKETGINPKQCAEIIESATKYSSLDDFRVLADAIRGSELLIPDDVGFEQAAHYIMRKKLDIRDSRGTFVPDLSDLSKLKPDVKYTILADNARLDSLRNITLPDNVNVVYVGDIANSANMLTSMTSESIEKRVKSILAQNGGDVDAALKALSFKEGYSALEIRKPADSALDTLTDRFKSRARKSVVKLDDDLRRVLTGEENLTLSEIFNLFEHKHSTMSIFTDEDMFLGIAAVNENIRKYAQSKGINPNEISYVVQRPSYKNDVKSQQFLAYRLKLQDGTAQISHLTDITPQSPTKLVVYLDDFAGSGNSIFDASRSIASTVLEGSPGREVLVAPIISNPKVDTRLNYKYKKGGVSLLDSPYKVVNNGLSDTITARNMGDVSNILKTADYVKVNEGILDELARRPRNDIFIYDIRHYESIDPSKAASKGAKYKIIDGTYASRVPPYIAQHDILSYQGCSTGVLTPTMGSNTNSNSINFFFRELLGDNGTIVKYHDMTQGVEKHNFYHIIKKNKGGK